MGKKLAGMSAEPPPEYVAFVTRHLPTLRYEALEVTGNAEVAAEIFPQALSEVAARWWFFDLLRRLGQPEAADRFLRRGFHRRLDDWRAGEHFVGEIEVTCESAPLGTGGRPPAGGWPRVGGWSPAGRRTRPPDSVTDHFPPAREPGWSSVALRIAAYTVPEPAVEFGPALEAAVAWLHAYLAHRRRTAIRWIILVATVFMVLLQLRTGLGEQTAFVSGSSHG